MHRRTFLQSSAAALGGLAVMGLPAPLRAAVHPAAVPARLGVQLYTVRDVFPNDFVGVLEFVRHIGYDEVEFAGYHDRDPRVIRAVLDDVGLAAPAAHVGLDAFRSNLDATLDAARTVGHRFLVIPWLDAKERTSLDDYRRIAGTLNEIGQRVQAAGMQLAYHNHDFEFETFGGDTPGFDVLLAETDPALVQVELDLYWVVAAGRDPLAYFERFPGRFPLVHVKDRTAGGEMADVGAGAIDFGRLFARAEQAGIRHAFVEHDRPENPLASIQASYAHLDGLRGS